MKRFLLILTLFIPLFTQVAQETHAQVVPVGSGSYTATFPAGTLPTGHTNWQPQTNLPWESLIHEDAHPLITSNMAGKPVPTNDWWSSLVWPTQIGGDYFPHSLPMWAYPVVYQARATGMGMGRPVDPPVNGRFHMAGYGVDMVLTGVDGINAPDARLHDFSDWTVTADLDDGTNHFRATMGHGMPFSYYQKISGGNAFVDFGSGHEIAHSAGPECIIFFSQGRKWAVFGPEGSTWVKSGARYTSTLNGKDYWSIALLPEIDGESTTTVDAALFEDYRKRAYAFPTNTEVSWNYNEATATLTSTYTVSTQLKEAVNGNVNNTLQALLPHQWRSVSGPYWANSYGCMRGEMKVLDGNSFTIAENFNGVLPTLPNLGQFSPGYEVATMSQLLDEAVWDNLQITESYNQGKNFFKFIQIVHMAEQMGNTAIRDNALNQIKNALEEWLTAQAGELSEVFYYNDEWGVMLGYPDGHYASSLLNDHHFHWAYFIHAGAVLEQYQPGWAAQWGGMIDLLIRDAASPDRNDTMFPFMRNFDPYAGHSWANGGARDYVGNDQESSSESMQFNTTMILWGELTGNTQLRDMGIYLYLTEKAAIEEYWWDQNNRNFPDNFQYNAVGRIFGGGNQLATVWTIDIPEAYGINYLPIHGGSFYLGQNTAYVEQAYNDMLTQHGANEPDLWNDIFWMYLSLANPQEALDRFNAYPDYPVEYAETKAHTYHWLHNMNAMGQVETGITADHPISAVFDKNGVKTYVAHNYSSSPITVTFSDGYQLSVPAGSMATSKDSPIQVAITSPSTGSQVASGSTVSLTATASGATISSVEFYRGSTLIGTDNTSPYTATDAGLADGNYVYTARAYSGTSNNTSNPVTVTVGQGTAQSPYNGTVQSIPGTIQIAHFDEGGEGVAYHDADGRNGEAQGIRPTERVDLEAITEGNTVGWVDPTEWLEYTVNVTAGEYTIALRAATPNGSAGPYSISLDGQDIVTGQAVTSTGGWGTFQTQSITGVNITTSGTKIMRFSVGGGGFNLGNITFTRTGDAVGGDTQAPSTPGSLAIASSTQTSIDLSWAASTDNVGVTGYEVYNGSTLLATTTGTSYSATGLMASTSYTFSVRALDAAGNSSAYADVTGSTADPVADTQAPSTPTALAISGSTYNSIALSWNASTDNIGVSGYEVFNGSTSLGTTASTSYTATGLAASTAYTFSVQAYDAAGNTSSQASVSGSTADAPVFAGTMLEDFETNRVATFDWASGSYAQAVANPSASGANTSTLVGDYTRDGGSQWDVFSYAYNVADASLFASGTNTFKLDVYTGNAPVGTLLRIQLETSASAGNNYPTGRHSTYEASTTVQNAWETLTFTYSGSPDGGASDTDVQKLVFLFAPDSYTGYRFYIDNLRFEGASTPVDGEAPSIPSALAASNITTSSVDLAWSGSSDNVGVMGYNVFNGATLLGTTTGTSYSVTGLVDNTAYTFYVSAFDAAGNTSATTSVAATTLQDATDAQAPTTPVAVAASNVTTTSVDLSWSASTDNVGVTGYNVFNGTTLLGTTTNTSYAVNGLTENTTYTFSVSAYDAAGNTSVQASVTTTTQQGSTGSVCAGTGQNSSGNGPDYTWEMTNGANPTILFKPARAGVGQGIVIFRYRLGGTGDFPGYIVNVDANGNYPYTITAAAGESVEFYYAYTVPEGGERNNLNDKHSATVDNCGGSAPVNQAPTVSITSPIDGNTYTASGAETITASASDADGSVSLVEFFVNGGLVGSDNSAPFSTTWTLPGNGPYSITAVATDDDGATTTSSASTVTVNISSGGGSGDACGGEAIGFTTAGVKDFDYSVSTGANPTITFAPARSGVGSTLRLAIVNGAGYAMTANGDGTYSHQTNFAVGTNFTYYFVYNVPEGGERNTAASLYSCTASNSSARGVASEPSTALTEAFRIRMFPNPAQDQVNIMAEGAQGEITLRVLNTTGQEVLSEAFSGTQHTVDVSGLTAGMYLVYLQAGDTLKMQKLIVK